MTVAESLLWIIVGGLCVIPPFVVEGGVTRHRFAVDEKSPIASEHSAVAGKNRDKEAFPYSDEPFRTSEDGGRVLGEDLAMTLVKIVEAGNALSMSPSPPPSTPPPSPSPTTSIPSSLYPWPDSTPSPTPYPWPDSTPFPTSYPTTSPTSSPTTSSPTTSSPTTSSPTTSSPTTSSPSSLYPWPDSTPSPTPYPWPDSTPFPTSYPTTSPTTSSPTTSSPTTSSPTTSSPTTSSPTTASPTTASPTTAPPTTSSPTTCELSGGTDFVFDSYIKESDIIFDDIYVHHKFEINVKCDCTGKAVNGGTRGPMTVVNLVDDSQEAGPFINVVNIKDLQVDWEGGALEEDFPGWTIAATGAGLCFTPAAKAGVCLLVGGLGSELFDDEILWGYRRSATFTCVKDGDTWEVQMTEQGPPASEKWSTNDSEFYTEYDSS